MTESVTVTAGIVVKDGLVLCARRAPKRSLAGYWEFPGGKVETGESFIDALQRELIEELSLSVTVKQFFHENTHSYPEVTVHLLSYLVVPQSDAKLGRDHDQLKWLPSGELAALDWSAADIPVVEKLKRQGIDSFS